MTDPLSRIPPPAPFVPALPRFCERCEIHMATTTHPTCPVCDDDRLKEQK